MAPIEEHRVHYLKVALNQIDRHRKRYETREYQDDILGRLIEKHDLKYTFIDRTKFLRQVRKLKTPRYREELSKLIQDHRKSSIKKKPDVSALFNRGSSIIDDDYLAKLNYQKPPPSKKQDSDDDSDTDENEDEDEDEEEVEQFEMEIPDLPVAEPHDAGGGSSATAAALIEIPNSIEGSSQEVQLSVEDAQAQVAKKRIAPTAISETPLSNSAPETKKRKRDEADEVVLEPLVKPVSQSGAVEIPEGRTRGPEEATPQSELQASQRGRAHDNAATTKAPSPESLSAATLPKLSNSELIKDLGAIWARIQSVALNLEAEMNDPATPVHLHLHPNPEPMSLILRVFGNRDWHKRASELILADVINKGGFVEAIFSAATYELIIETELPWSHPEQILESLNDKQKYFDQVLSVASKATGLRMHTVVWQGAILEAEDKRFHQHTVRPHAKDLAQKFMMHVSALLKATWTRKPRTEAFWDKITEQVATVFGKALIMKRQMEVAPDYYRWSWIESGAAFDNTRMEELDESTGEQEVVWTLTPLIEKRQTQDAAWQVLCPARVLTRPRPEV